MLVCDDGDAGGWLAIGQASHAWVSGQLARAWGTPRLPAPQPWEAVCLAAEQHDVGMAEWDLRPTLDPTTGRATAFTAMPRETHLALWRRAPSRLETQSSYAALLVSLHGTTLYTSFRRPGADAPEVDAYLAEQRRYQDALVARLGADRAALERNRRLIACWDALSLALCLRWPARELPAVLDADGGEVRIRLEPTTHGATLDPWPFAAATVGVEAEGRRLPGGLADADALHDALRDAGAVELRWMLRPPG